MKKNLFSTLLLIVMIAALMVTAAGCGAKDDGSAARIAELEKENAALKAQIEELTGQAPAVSIDASLKDWSLDAAAWADGNGATVTFTAVPETYAEGMKAALSVRMNDLEAESTNCVWDGSAFTGSVELGAMDGYSYFCVLTSPDGTQEQLELDSPANVVNDALVNLGSSLNAYANMIVEDWASDKDSLTINSGYIQVQLPRLSTDIPTVSSAVLVLKMNGEEADRQDVALEAGEGEGAYELALTGTSFSMPDMDDDYQLDLQLEVALSNGNTVSVSGGSWFCNDGELTLVVG